MLALLQTEVIDATGKAASQWGWPVVILVCVVAGVIYIYKKHLGPWLEKQTSLIDKQVQWADQKTDAADAVLQDALTYTRQQNERADQLREGVLKDLSDHMRTQTSINQQILGSMEANRRAMQGLEDEVRRGRHS
jgi:hypothetical protein